MLIDFENEFSDLLVSYTGTRYNESIKDNEGLMTAGQASTFTFKATYPQPVSQNDLKMIAEGSTPSSAVVIHSVTRLKITSGGVKGDTISWRGDDYFVVQVNERDSLSSCYRVVMRKVQAGE
jgi:hypothetical protein